MPTSVETAMKEVEEVFKKHNLAPIEVVYICEVLKQTEIEEVCK